MLEYMSTVLVFAGTFLLALAAFRRRARSSTALTTAGRQAPPSLPCFPVVGSVMSLPDFGKFHVAFLDLMSTLGGMIAFKLGSR